MNSTHPTTLNTWYWIGGIIAAAAIAYFMFFSAPSPSSDSALLETGRGEEMIGSQVLSLLNQIQSLRIDPTLFQSAVYKSLQDFSVNIPPEGVGRDNPFAPIPGYAK
ncbi:MAG: hypothetical protein AAB777_01580 [Patescibacteria group bacterium]